MNIFVSGSLAYDRIMDFPGQFADHILPDKIHTLNVSFGLDTLSIKHGGTAGNIAYNLALFKQEPYIISQVGEDFAEYRSALKQRAIKLDYVRTVKQERTATAHIITDQHDNQIAGFYFGAMRTPATKDKAIVAKLKPKLKSAQDSIAIIAPGNVDDMLNLAKLYRQNNVPYIFDPGQQLVWLEPKQIQTLLDGAFCLIVNDYELSLVESKLNITTQQLQDQVDRLIVTLGEQGAEWYVDGEFFTMPIVPPKKMIDPTGAGDAYRAGIIAGLVNDWDIETTGRVAALCATYCIEHYGTQEHEFTISAFKQRLYKTCKRKINL
jgi:adenosine kinase